MTNVKSSLQVIITTYNGGSKESFNWTELLEHLTNNRNPFVTVQLLPKHITPDKYMFDINAKDTSAFTGEEEEDKMAIQKGLPDFDGAPHPNWYSNFKFNFQLPDITSCTLLSTEVVKVKMDGANRYAMVMIRKAVYKKEYLPLPKDIFPMLFLTLYDPRTASDYQCGLKPIPKDYNNCEKLKSSYAKLHQYLFPSGTDRVKKGNDKDNEKFEVEFLKYVSDAAEYDMFIVGPAITPRLEFSIYNSNGKKRRIAWIMSNVYFFGVIWNWTYR